MVRVVVRLTKLRALYTVANDEPIRLVVKISWPHSVEQSYTASKGSRTFPVSRLRIHGLIHLDERVECLFGRIKTLCEVDLTQLLRGRRMEEVV